MALPDPKTPTRSQLYKLLGNHELVKIFEKLFERAGDVNPDDIATLNRLVEESSIDANTGISKANQAIGMIHLLDKLTEEANMDAGTATAKANQAIGGTVLNEIKSKSNGVLMWLSM